MAARPLRADELCRSRSSDEGVECGSVSASVRRGRSSLGTFLATTAELSAFTAFLPGDFGLAEIAGFLPFARFVLAGAFFLALALGFEARLAMGRLAERLGAGRFFADFVGFARRTGLRFAMLGDLSNLDSFALSVVLSVAYRDSEKLSGTPAPA